MYGIVEGCLWCFCNWKSPWNYSSKEGCFLPFLASFLVAIWHELWKASKDPFLPLHRGMSPNVIAAEPWRCKGDMNPGFWYQACWHDFEVRMRWINSIIKRLPQLIFNHVTILFSTQVYTHCSQLDLNTLLHVYKFSKRDNLLIRETSNRARFFIKIHTALINIPIQIQGVLTPSTLVVWVLFLFRTWIFLPLCGVFYG